MAVTVSVFALVISVVTFLANAKRWRHEGVEKSLDELTSPAIATARSALYRLPSGPQVATAATGADPDLVDHHFAILWCLERTWFRRKRRSRQVLSRVFGRRLEDYDEAIRPHVAECLRLCASTRLLIQQIEDEETRERVRKLATALDLPEDGGLVPSVRPANRPLPIP